MEEVRQILESLLEELQEGKKVIKVKHPGSLTKGKEFDKLSASYFKNKLTSGELSWDALSKKINNLYVWNKNKNPSFAQQAKSMRDSLAKWVESKRKDNPDFAK